MVIQRLGPKAATMDVPCLTLSKAQREVLVELEEIGKLYARKATVSTSLRRSMPKAMYWLGTAILSNHVGEQLFPHALRGTSPTDWSWTVSDAVFRASMQFMHRRYLFGQAVLSVSVDEQAWIGRETALPLDSKTDLPLLLKVLRGTPGPLIGEAHVVCVELSLKRLLRKGTTQQVAAARKRILSLLEALEQLHLGVMVHSETEAFLHKFTVDALSAQSVAWLRKHRVPLTLFGVPQNVDHGHFAAELDSWPDALPPEHEDVAATAIDASGAAAALHPEPCQPASPELAVMSRDRTAADATDQPKPKIKEGAPCDEESRELAGSSTATPSTSEDWTMAGVHQVPGPLLTQQGVRELLAKHAAWASCRVEIRQRYHNKDRLQFRIQCVDDLQCPKQWKAFYTLTPVIHPPGTLLVWVTGEHCHTSEAGNSKVFSAGQLQVARTFVDSGGMASKDLKLALQAANAGERLPTDQQLSNWLKRARALRKVMPDKATKVVEVVRGQLQDIPRAPTSDLCALYLVDDPLLSQSEAGVANRSEG